MKYTVNINHPPPPNTGPLHPPELALDTLKQLAGTRNLNKQPTTMRNDEHDYRRNIICHE